MDIKTILANNFNIANLIDKGINVLFIAVVFELLVWWIGRRIEKGVAPLLSLAQNRDAAWRARRTLALKGTPKAAVRAACYTSAMILVLNVFNVPILPLSMALGAVALLIGAALIPQARDIAQGYSLLADDVLAPGDIIELDGKRGLVEKFTLRGLWMRDEAGRSHFYANRNVQSVSLLGRRQEAAPKPTPAFDPLAPSPAKPTLPNTPAST
jgi:small-conductance mechanosensitive channel